MLEQDDRIAIIETVHDMIREQMATPFENLMLALIFELLAHSSIDYAQLATRLESFWATMKEEEKDGPGARSYQRIYRLLAMMRDDPQQFLSSVGHNEERLNVPPEWLRGVIQGGRPDDDEDDDR